MHDKLYYKCPSCKWTVRIQEGGILDAHEAETGHPCHMSNQFPLDRLSNDAHNYQLGIQWLNHFADLIGDKRLHMWLEGEWIHYQCGDRWGMMVNVYDVLQMDKQGKDGEHRIMAWRIELAKRLGVTLPEVDR